MGGETCFLYKIDQQALQEYAAFSETIRGRLEGAPTLTIVLHPNAEPQDFSLDYLTFIDPNQQDFIKTIETIKFVGNVKFLKRGLNTGNFNVIFEKLENIMLPTNEGANLFPGAFSDVELNVEHKPELSKVEEGEIPKILEACTEAQVSAAEKKRMKAERKKAAKLPEQKSRELTNEDRTKLYVVTENWTGDSSKGEISLKEGEQVIVEGEPDNQGMVLGRRVYHSREQEVSGKFPINKVQKIVSGGGSGGKKKRRTYKKGKKSKRRNTRRRNSRRRSRRNNKSK